MTQANILLPAALTFSYRVEGDTITPTYLNGPTFKAYRYSMSVIYDDAQDVAAMAVRAAIPSLAPLDALQWLAQDRQVFQGPGETAAGYIARLRQWLDLWRLDGTSTSVLLAFLAWLTPLAPEVATVTTTLGGAYAFWSTYATTAAPFPPGTSIPSPPILIRVAPANWDWDGSSQPYYYPWVYWRSWVILRSSGPQAPWAAPTATWGSGGTYALSIVSDAVYGTVYVNGGTPASSSGTSFNWGNGVTCWGWAGTAQQASQLTALAKTWKSAGVWVPWIVVSYDPAWFLASGAVGTDMPDGAWGYYAKVVADATYGTIYTPSRPSCATCSLIAGPDEGDTNQPLGLG